MKAAGRRDCRCFDRWERIGGSTERCWLNRLTVTRRQSPERGLFAAAVNEIAGRGERQ
jgi:hypothetical protein